MSLFKRVLNIIQSEIKEVEHTNRTDRRNQTSKRVTSFNKIKKVKIYKEWNQNNHLVQNVYDFESRKLIRSYFFRFDEENQKPFVNVYSNDKLISRSHFQGHNNGFINLEEYEIYNFDNQGELVLEFCEFNKNRFLTQKVEFERVSNSEMKLHHYTENNIYKNTTSCIKKGEVWHEQKDKVRDSSKVKPIFKSKIHFEEFDNFDFPFFLPKTFLIILLHKKLLK